MSHVNCQQCGEVMQVEDVADEPSALCPKCTRERFATVWMEIDGRMCPLCGDPNPKEATHCGACGEPLAAVGEALEVEAARVRVFRVFQDAWYVYVARFPMAFGGQLLGTLLSTAMAVLVVLMFSKPGPAMLFGMLLHLIWGTFIQLGQARLAVRICRDQSPPLGDLFAEGQRLFPGLVGLLASSVVSYILLLMMAVPMVVLVGGSPAFGYYLMGFAYAALVLLSPVFLMCPLAVFFTLVDQERGWWSSYRFALAMLWRNSWRLYVGTLFLAAVVVAAICTCGVALLFAVPYCWILAAVGYLHASNQIAATDPVFLGRRRSVKGEE
jgi:hypothetical protein